MFRLAAAKNSNPSRSDRGDDQRSLICRGTEGPWLALADQEQMSDNWQQLPSEGRQERRLKLSGVPDWEGPVHIVRKRPARTDPGLSCRHVMQSIDAFPGSDKQGLLFPQDQKPISEGDASGLNMRPSAQAISPGIDGDHVHV